MKNKIFKLFFFLILVIIVFGGFITHSKTKKVIKAIDNKDYETIEKIAGKRNFNINRGLSFIGFFSYAHFLPPLHYACVRDDFKAAEILIKYGADINLIIDDWPPILYAQDCDEIIVLLIEKGADPSYKDKRDLSIINYILRGKNDDVEDVINRYELFLKIIEKDKTLAYKELRGPRGFNYLHYAVSYNNYKIVEYLIKELNFDINEKNKTNETSLMIAVKENNIKTVECLLKNGADVTLKNDEGKTALDLARDKGNAEIVGMLENANNSFQQ